jgi:hypothetical protein
MSAGSRKTPVLQGPLAAACSRLAVRHRARNGLKHAASAELAPDACRPRYRPRRYRPHGFYALKTMLRALGPRVLDRRTTLGKALAAWKADLVRDLGGDVSTQQAAIIDLAVRTKLLLDSVDAWLLVQPSLVNVREKALLLVVRERQQLADSLSRMLERLGFERRARPFDLAPRPLQPPAPQPLAPRRQQEYRQRHRPLYREPRCATLRCRRGGLDF